ncbi:MAG: periplasmic heavy metal sensor [Bacillota bacterium]
MRRRYVVMVLAAILVVGSVSVASARGFGLMDKAGTRMQGCESLDSLDLTEEQFQAMRAIDEAYFARNLELRTAMFTKNFELRQLLWTKERDEGAIEAKRAELQALHEAMKELTQERHEQMQSLLTDEQRQQLQERAQTRQSMMKGMIMRRQAKGFMGARGF